jgi:hypothetical protein
LIGFYGGPAADLINQEERKSREKKWLDRLDESTKVIFEDARNGVLARYIEMTDESATAKERAITTAKAEKEKSLAELQIEGGKLDEKAPLAELDGVIKRLHRLLLVGADLAGFALVPPPLMNCWTFSASSSVRLARADPLPWMPALVQRSTSSLLSSFSSFASA